MTGAVGQSKQIWIDYLSLSGYQTDAFITTCVLCVPLLSELSATLILSTPRCHMLSGQERI